MATTKKSEATKATKATTAAKPKPKPPSIINSGLTSFAGSNATYSGNDAIRMRRFNEDTVRVHVAKGAVRIRDAYYAFEVPLAVLEAITKAVKKG